MSRQLPQIIFSNNNRIIKKCEVSFSEGGRKKIRTFNKEYQGLIPVRKDEKNFIIRNDYLIILILNNQRKSSATLAAHNK